MVLGKLCHVNQWPNQSFYTSNHLVAKRDEYPCHANIAKQWPTPTSVFVSILIALPNCIWHMPYSMFITLFQLKKEWYAQRKCILHVVECNSTLQFICSHFNCTAELHLMACPMHLAHSIFYVHDPPQAHRSCLKRIWHTKNAFNMLWNGIQQCNVFATICCHAKTIARIRSINRLSFPSMDLKTTQYMWLSTG